MRSIVDCQNERCQICKQHCFKFVVKFQQIDGRVAVQKVYGRFFSGGVFTVHIPELCGIWTVKTLWEKNRPFTGKIRQNRK